MSETFYRDDYRGSCLCDTLGVASVYEFPKRLVNSSPKSRTNQKRGAADRLDRRGQPPKPQGSVETKRLGDTYPRNNQKKNGSNKPQNGSRPPTVGRRLSDGSTRNKPPQKSRLSNQIENYYYPSSSESKDTGIPFYETLEEMNNGKAADYLRRGSKGRRSVTVSTLLETQSIRDDRTSLGYIFQDNPYLTSETGRIGYVDEEVMVSPIKEDKESSVKANTGYSSKNAAVSTSELELEVAKWESPSSNLVYKEKSLQTVICTPGNICSCKDLCYRCLKDRSTSTRSRRRRRRRRCFFFG